MSEITVEASVTLTPAKLAELYWELDASEQADFFEHLGQIAGIKLCYQTAAVVNELYRRDKSGERDASKAFHIMFSHSQYYLDGLVERMSWEAKWDIEARAQEAKRQIQSMLSNL